jgi:hypothetical protein
LIAGHIAAQSVFTVAAHMAAVRRAALDRPGAAKKDGLLRQAIPFLPAAALPLGFAGAFSIDPLGLSVDVYVRFLAFYGLVFPAYVLLFIVGGEARSRRDLAAFAIAVVVLLPLYELGFLHGREWLLPIPPAIIAVWAALRYLRNADRGPRPGDN